MSNSLLKKFIVVALLVFSFSSCSIANKPFFHSKSSANNFENAKEGEGNLFSLKILERVNDGDKIYILGEALAKESVLIKDVNIKVRLMGRNGEVISEQIYPFASLMGKDKSETFEKNISKKFLVSIDYKFSNITPPSDFQLELSWGQNNFDSTNVSSINVPNQTNLNRQEALRMVNLAFEKKLVSLNDKDPKYYFVISGEFENLSDKIVNEISIAVSFKSKLSDNRLSSDEEFLEIKDINLNPKSSKKFEMELETILNSQDANIYKPDIKIVSFS